VKSYIVTAGVALAAFAAVSVVQRKFFAVPVLGEFLPR